MDDDWERDERSFEQNKTWWKTIKVLKMHSGKFNKTTNQPNTKKENKQKILQNTTIITVQDENYGSLI